MNAGFIAGVHGNKSENTDKEGENELNFDNLYQILDKVGSEQYS